MEVERKEQQSFERDSKIEKTRVERSRPVEMDKRLTIGRDETAGKGVDTLPSDVSREVGKEEHAALQGFAEAEKESSTKGAR